MSAPKQVATDKAESSPRDDFYDKQEDDQLSTFCEALMEKAREDASKNALVYSPFVKVKWGFTCGACGHKFDRLHLYQAHRREHHSSATTAAFKCRTCSKKFSGYEQLRKHTLFKH